MSEESPATRLDRLQRWAAECHAQPPEAVALQLAA